MLALAVMLNPLVFGSLVDSACLVWEEVCGDRGSCWVYSSDDFRLVGEVEEAEVEGDSEEVGMG